MATAIDLSTQPKQADKVVEEYKDIFSPPIGVSLRCQVKHPIDLNPYALLPNGLVYRRSLLENEEIKHQIEELVHKGTSDLVHHLVEALSCWCIRKIGHGDYALITGP
jgi:hypothetical protein